MANPALNTNISRAAGSLVRVRFEIQETAGVAIASAYELRYSHNGAAYVLLGAPTGDPATNPPLAYGNSAMFAHGDLTTNVLPSGTGTFVAGVGSETGGTPSISLGGSGHTELEFAVLMGAAEMAGGPLATGATLDLRVYRAGTPLNTYSFTPRITVA